MTQRLEVNNKTYFPSVVLAKEFNYTSDYISKLARDEKVLGTRVGRQWFVEPESLRTFILQLEVEKKIVKENLSRERKQERLQKTIIQKESVPGFESAAVVGGKSVAVVLCGFVLGCLMLFGHTYELRPVDLTYGAKNIAHALGEKVGAGFLVLVAAPEMPTRSVANPLLSEQSSLSLEAALPAAPESFVADVYTTFPDSVYATATLATFSENSTGTQAAAVTAVLPFSDEVVLEVREGNVGVRPIFKDLEGGLYELSVRVIEDTE